MDSGKLRYFPVFRLTERRQSVQV